MNAEFKSILLKDIKPDPNQPRKYYDETAMSELIDSVREKGILQPILIRPNGKGYIVVCGERRLKAALAVQIAIKDRDSIPAVIRHLSNDEALELQIIENLQRKDVHPMEEAVAIKSLIENKSRPLTIEQVAAKIGKTVYYIRQRNKLNSLRKDWQDVFYRGKLHVSVALEISALAANEQDHLFKMKVDIKRLDKPEYSPSISDYDLNQLKRVLKEAPFDIKDETLNAKMGSCLKCPFNSAIGSLFAEDEKNPVCNNQTCYNTKCTKAFEVTLKEAINDPGVVLIYNYLNNNQDRALRDKLIKDGHKVYETPDTCTISTSWQYKELKGLPVKGFYIGGHEKGKFINVKLKLSASSNQTKQKQKDGKLTLADIDGEIKRISDREKRNKELDLNKIHQETLVQLSKKKSLLATMKMQGVTDRSIMIYILLHETNGVYQLKQKTGIKGLPSEPPYNSRGYAIDYFKALSKITDDQLAQIIRTIALDKWGGTMTGDMRTEDTACRLIAEYAGIDLKAIEKAQAELSEKRQERVKDRISNLKEYKSLLSKKKK